MIPPFAFESGFMGCSNAMSVDTWEKGLLEWLKSLNTLNRLVRESRSRTSTVVSLACWLILNSCLLTWIPLIMGSFFINLERTQFSLCPTPPLTLAVTWQLLPVPSVAVVGISFAPH